VGKGGRKEGQKEERREGGGRKGGSIAAAPVNLRVVTILFLACAEEPRLSPAS